MRGERPNAEAVSHIRLHGSGSGGERGGSSLPPPHSPFGQLRSALAMVFRVQASLCVRRLAPSWLANHQYTQTHKEMCPGCHQPGHICLCLRQFGVFPVFNTESQLC